MACAGRQCIEYAVDEDRAECSPAITLRQSGIAAVIQLIGNAAHADTLSGIAEGFGTGNQQHIIICVVSYRRLERSLIRSAQILTEIHCKVCQVFQYDYVILGGKFADDAQLFVFQANPARVIGV